MYLCRTLEAPETSSDASLSTSVASDDISMVHVFESSQNPHLYLFFEGYLQTKKLHLIN